MLTRLSTWWMLKAYKVMLCHVDERESIYRATVGSVKDALFKVATCLGTYGCSNAWHCWSYIPSTYGETRARTALSVLMPFIQCVDVLQTVASDNGVEEAHGNSDIYLGSPHSDGSGPFPAAPDITVQSQQFGNKMLDAEDLATFWGIEQTLVLLQQQGWMVSLVLCWPQEKKTQI
jgi:hypothetical protein